MSELVTIGGFAVAIIGSIGAMIWKFNDSADSKIKRVYERFDEYKTSFEGKHVAKDICKILHERIEKDLDEIKLDIKEILRIQKNGGQG